MFKRSRRETFKEAIATALAYQLDERGREIIAPFLGNRDLFLEIQRSSWFEEMTPSVPADPLGLVNRRETLIDDKRSDRTIRVTVRATSNGSSIFFWSAVDNRAPYDRVDLVEHDPILVTLICKLAGLNVRLEEGVLVQPVPNPFWLYHPERMRCSRPHMQALRGIENLNARGKIVQEQMEKTYSRWIRLKDGHYDRLSDALVSQSEIEANYNDFDKAGRHIYRIEPDLVEMLRSSDLENIPYDALRLPHEAFYLHFGAQSDLTDTLGRPLEGVYICQGKTYTYFCFVFESVTAEDVMEWTVGKDPFVIVMLRPGPTLKDALVNGLKTTREMFEDMLAKAKINVSIYETGSPEWMKAVVHQLSGERNVRQFAQTLKFTDNIGHALSLAINSVLFITTYDDVALDVPDTASEQIRRQVTEGNAEQRSRAQRKLATDGFVVVNHVGGKLRGSGSESAQAGTKRAHWRRGFWRMQRFGKGFSDARLTWIRPTLVSGHGAPAELHGIIHQIS